MDKNTDAIPDFNQLAEEFKKLKSEQKGWIMVPDFTGFKLYEISVERLEKYLTIERIYRHNNNPNQ